MDEALRGLDADLRREYDIACQEAPELVRQETPKAKFLRTDNNNPWNAARRLALYWKFRRECMTPERWLLPMMTKMTATNKCCLGDDEIALLQRGIYHYSNHAATGPVVVVNSSQNVDFSVETSGRILLYLGTVLEDTAVQTSGVTVVYVATSSDTVSHIDPRFGEYMAKGLPAKVRRFVVVQNYEPHKQPLVEYLAVRRQLQIQTLYGAPDCEIIASSHSQADLLHRVAQAGIPTAALPASCGGGARVLCEFLRQRLPSVVTQDEISFRGDAISTRSRDSVSLSHVPEPPSSMVHHNNNNKRKFTEDYDTPDCHGVIIKQQQAERRTVSQDDIVLVDDEATTFPSSPATALMDVQQAIAGGLAVVVEENLDFGFPVLDPWEESLLSRF